MAGQWRVLVLLVAIAATGCVPIPYKPSAGVNHVPITAEEASAITLSSGRDRAALIGPLVKSMRHAEHRIVVVDGTPDIASLTAGQGTLAGVLKGADGSGAAPDADYLLCVGSQVHRQLHDTGAAAPFPYFPVIWVGYEKVQSRDSVIASLIDLHTGLADRLEVSTTYSEVIAAAVYGIATVARPGAALRDALAAEVAHRLAVARATGAIRLIVVAQEGGTAEADPNKPKPEPRHEVAQAH